MRLLMFMIDF